MKKTLALLALSGALAFAVERSVTLEDDPIRSLAHPDPTAAALFDRYQERSPFRGKIFVEMGELSPGERERLDEALAQGGYREEPLFASPTPGQVLSLAPLLPVPDLRRLLGDDALEARAAEARAMAGLPGGDGYLEALQGDPVGLGPALLARFAAPPSLTLPPQGGGKGEGSAPGAALHAYRSPSPLDYDKVEGVYRALLALRPKVHFIGGDFFAYENYRAIQRDILICSALTLVLNLAVFFLFTGRWALLGLLFLGTVISNLAGLLAIRAFYPQVFAVVLAYTSTFVGFNNESLVHLAGIEEAHRRRSLLGIWSAIGTTVIGFLVLLVGRSVLIREMALASLGGTVGFLLFLYPYREVLNGVRFRGFDWPKLTVPAAAVAAFCAACTVGIALVGVPRIGTRIAEFRFQSPALGAEVAHFSKRLDEISLENVVAVPVNGTPDAALADLTARGLADASRHPLARWRPLVDQEESLRVLREAYPRAAARVRDLLARSGIRLTPATELPGSVHPLGAWEYLDRLREIGPVRWADDVGGRRYLFVGLKPRALASAGPGLLPMTPEHHFDLLLTGLSRDLGSLFLAGFVAMAVYLGLLQKSMARVLYVFAPLFPSALLLAVVMRASGGTLTIVHFMGFSLVIALALDYTAVAVSTDHGQAEMAKILLTGLSTLATFGVLILARHPVMRDLGITTVVGCVVSLLFALFVKLTPREEGS